MEDHSGSDFEAIFSPDGQYILSASWNGTVRLWSKEGRLIETLKGHTDRISSAVFSPDGQNILTASQDKTARLWDKSGNLVKILEGHTDSIWQAEFSPDAQYILTTSDKEILLWYKSGKLVKTFLYPLEHPIFTPVFSPNGQYILIPGEGDIAELWYKNDAYIKILQGHTGIVWGAVFSLDGQSILTASEDSTARLWDKNGNLLKILESHTGPIRTAMFSPDGEYILTADGQSSTRLWNKNGQFVKILEGDTAMGFTALRSPEGHYITGVGRNKAVLLVDKKGKAIKYLGGHKDIVLTAVFSPDGEFILTASRDKTVRLWDKNGKLVKVLQGHTGIVRTAVFSPDGQYILTASDDNTARLWDKNGNLVRTLEGHTSRVMTAVFSPDGQYILTASLDNTARLWESYPLYLHRHWVLSTADLLFGGAEIELKKVLATGSRNEINDLGYIYFNKNNLENARRCYEKVNQMEQTTESLRNLYRIADTVEIQNAIKHLLIKNDVQELRIYGDFLFELAEWEEAKQLYEKAEDKEHSKEVLQNLFVISKFDNEHDFHRVLSLTDPNELEYYSNYFTQEAEKIESNREKVPDYQKALRIRKRQLFFDTTTATRITVANEYVTLAYYQLFLPDGKAAEVSLRRALELDPSNKYIPTNLAPALALQNRFKEAKTEYLHWAPKPFNEQNLPTYRDVFLDDFKAFRKAGVKILKMEEIETLLKAMEIKPESQH